MALGRSAEARRDAESAERGFHALGAHFNAADVHRVLALCDRAEGLLGQAEGRLGQARELARSTGSRLSRRDERGNVHSQEVSTPKKMVQEQE